MKRVLFLVTVAVLLSVGSTAAQQAVFVVRHAERADTAAGGSPMMASDPDLSIVGRARARSLASVLKDAGIRTILVSEFKRTQQTAAPIAKALGIQPTIVTAKDTAGLVEKVKAATGNVLVIGHSNTVPEVIAGLGIETPVKLADADYDNLFVLFRVEKPILVRIHYR